MSNGQELRNEKLSLRDRLSHQERFYKSEIIARRLIAHEKISEATNIFIYVSFRSEVRTIEIIEKILHSGKIVSVPVTHVKEKRMEAVHIEDMERDLVPGYCGIPEPTSERVKNNVLSPEDIDVVIVPGSVFDERGGRFGYGGGYYDRFLQAIPKAYRIGLAYELQMIARAPLQPHDEFLDCIISEKRIIKTSREGFSTSKVEK